MVFTVNDVLHMFSIRSIDSGGINRYFYVVFCVIVTIYAPLNILFKFDSCCNIYFCLN